MIASTVLLVSASALALPSLAEEQNDGVSASSAPGTTRFEHLNHLNHLDHFDHLDYIGDDFEMNAQLLMTPDKQVYLNFQPANPSANQHHRDAPHTDNDNPNNRQRQGELLQSMDNEKPFTEDEEATSTLQYPWQNQRQYGNALQWQHQQQQQKQQQQQHPQQQQVVGFGYRKRSPVPEPNEGGNGLTLSITANMDALRSKLIRELIRRQRNGSVLGNHLRNVG